MNARKAQILRPGHIYPNMDIVRYLLAFAVVFAHIGCLTGFFVPFPISSFQAVGGFFSLSGFLMYPSFAKHYQTGKYLKSRAKRILPQYLAIIFLCSFGFVFISTLTASEYFSCYTFWKYLTANICFLNWLQPDLPGVFDGTQFQLSAVNGSLWTMKVEWCLYLSVPIFVWLISKIKIRAAWMALTIIILSICWRIVFQILYINTGNNLFEILGRQVFGQCSYFYCGMMVYFYLDWFKRHLKFILICSTILLLLPIRNMYYDSIAGPFYLTAFVMALSLLPGDIHCLRHNNNISYNIYLCHFPTIQLCIWFGITQYGSFITFSSVIILTIILSIFIEILLKQIPWLRRDKNDPYIVNRSGHSRIVK